MIKKGVMLGMALLLLFTALAFSARGAAVEVPDDGYLHFGEWLHATNAGGGHEASARSVLWRKAQNAPGLFYSVYLVEAHAWNADGQVPSGGWQESDMFLWLNGFEGAGPNPFYDNAFAVSEKNALQADPDGDAGSRVTLPDMYQGYARQSRFGVAKYRGSGNLEHWLRRTYEDTTATNDAWGVGVAGNEGPGAVNRVLGVRPLISLQLSSFLFRTGSGTEAAPYELYARDDSMKPSGLTIDGSELRIRFPVAVAPFGALPAPADFSLVRNEMARRQRSASVVAVEIPAGEPNVLKLTLSQAAAYQDGFSLSYNLPTGTGGTPTGGALVAASGARVALAPFGNLAVSNETPPTAGDVVIDPASELTAPAYRPFAAQLTVTGTRPDATVRLDAVTKSAGWDEALVVTSDATAATLEIRGTPTVLGRHTLLLDVTLGGAALSGIPVVVEVLPQNGLADIEIFPSSLYPIELRRETDVTYRVGSTVSDAHVELLSAAEGAGWSGNGLTFSADLPGGTFRVIGTPVRVGLYPVALRARIDGREVERTYEIEVVYPNTNPTPDDLLVTSDLVGPILTGRPLRFAYTVDSSIENAEVVLRDARPGEDWSGSGLELQVEAAARRIVVWGVPTTAGNYSLDIEAAIDGKTLPVHVETFTVGNPPSVGDVVFAPALPRATAYRPYRAETTVGSATPDVAVVLNNVSAGSEWLGSGLSFAFERDAGSVTVEGTPVEAGTFTLRVDVTIGGTRIPDAALALHVDPSDTSPGVGNVAVVPSTADPFVVNRPADVTYTVGSGIEDAVVVLRDVRPGEGWDAAALRFLWGGSGNVFSVYGTPRSAGSYSLFLDVEIDGTLVFGYEHRVTVAAAPPTADVVAFTPPLPAARTFRPYEATTRVESRSGGAVTLHGVSDGVGWGGSGMSYRFDTAANTVTVFGEPTREGLYELFVDASVGGVRLAGVPLTVSVEGVGTIPAPADIMVTPDGIGPLTVGSAAGRTYIVTTGIADANVRLAGIRGGTGWHASGLDFAYVPTFQQAARGTTSAAFTVYGTPLVAGDFPVLIDVEVDGEVVPGYRVIVEVADAPPTASDIVFTPAMPRATVGRPFEAATVVGSRTGEPVVLHGASGSIDWEASGLAYAISGTTVTISGTPARAGDYGLNLDVSIGGTRIEDGALAVRVEPADSAPSPNDLLVVAEGDARIETGKPADVRYRVTSGTVDAEVVLRAVRPGPLWEFGGLRFDYDASAATFRVTGTASRVGNYTLLLDVLLDGAEIDGYIVNVTVHPGADTPRPPLPPVVIDVLFSPSLPNAKAQRPFEATTTVGSRSGQSVVLHDVTPDTGWSENGLEAGFDAGGRTITVSGTPLREGVYTLLADLTIGGTRLTDEPLLLVVDSPGTKPTPDNVVLVPDRIGTVVVNRETEILYRIATGIEDARVSLHSVRAVAGWEKSGLAFSFDPAAGTFTVYGTPTAVGTYTLLLDMEIDGVRIRDYVARIVVVDDGTPGGDGGEDGWSGGSGGGCSGGALPFAAFVLWAVLRRRND